MCYTEFMNTINTHKPNNTPSPINVSVSDTTDLVKYPSILLRNKFTGEEIIIEKYNPVYHIRRRVKGIFRYWSRFSAPMYVYFLTLTVAENTSETKTRDLDRVMRFITRRVKRNGSLFAYLWVKEFQERGAIHYHVLMFTSKPYVIPDVKEINKSWRLGICHLLAKRGIGYSIKKAVNYMLKYISKELRDTRIVRKIFSSSLIRSVYTCSEKVWSFVRDNFSEVIDSLYVRGRRLYMRCADDDFPDLYVLRFIYAVPSDWKFVSYLFEDDDDDDGIVKE